MALTKTEILAAVNAKARNAYGADSTLESERAKALDYYLGRPFGNEVEGRSQVVTRDVLETVEWILPSLMRIFTAGDKVVEFDPVGPEDEAAAKQETDVMNHVIMQKNESFMTFLTWFKDAMLSRTSYVKIYYDTKEDATEETYENLSEQQLQMLAADQDVDVIETWLAPLGIGARLRRVSKVGHVCIDPVAPENMRISGTTRGVSLRDADYVEHREEKTISDLRQMGLDVPDDINGDLEESEDELDDARNLYDNEDRDYDEHADPSMRLVWLRDVTIRIDANGDGIAELKRYYIVGTEILGEYEAENVYYAALGPIPMPHRHVGLSIADLVMDIQSLRSTILRNYIDTLFAQTHGGWAISDRVNLDDMLVTRPNRIVRVEGDPAGAIMPMVTPNTGAASIQGLEYLDTHKENRTGVTKYNQGLDTNSLNKTATGISQIMGAAQARIELIARVFAETGVKDMFLLVHELLKKHQDRVMNVRLNNTFVEVDPRQWRTRTDMTVSVGIGTGNKDQQLQHLMTLLQVQREGLQIGITSPTHIYKAAKRLAENAGFKDGNEFFMEPQPQQPKPSPEEMKAQAQIQADKQKFDMTMQQKREEAQIDMQLAREKMANETQLRREQMAIDMQLEREKAAMQREATMFAELNKATQIDPTYEGVQA